MLSDKVLDFALWTSIIEFVGALLIICYLFAACIALLRGRGVTQARLLAADGIITGLSFKLAGTLLRTIQLHTWHQILMFVAILALRTILKRLFLWEQEHLQRSGVTQGKVASRAS